MMEGEKNIGVLILAAGGSSRLGQAKQLLEFDGKTLLENSVSAALATNFSVAVVLGARFEKIKKTIENLPIEIIFNEKWATGLSSSIRIGMEYLTTQNSDLHAVIIMLCDQPFVDENLLKKLVEKYQTSGQPIIASKYNGQPGVPALFDFSYFEKLQNLEGDKGAKLLIMNNLDNVFFINFEKGKWDVDTMEDFEKIKNKAF